jgi:peptidoglycan/LPS O-acetylase OafA/YrhL
LLALSVVRDHRPFFEQFWIIKGGVAVIIFYMISGFYMSMVITEKYSKQGPGWERNFLWHRALRLFPCYWAVLVFTLLVQHFMHTPNVYTDSLGLNLLERGLLLFSDTFIVGQDILIGGATLHWHDGPGGIVVSWSHFPVAVAWSVGVEITFYVLAAFFIVRDKRSAIFALVIAIYFRLYFLIVNGKSLGFSRDGMGYSNTPWGYHFFGIALIFFMLGWVAYQLYLALDARLKRNPRFIRAIQAYTAGLVVLILLACLRFNGFQDIKDYNDPGMWLAVPLFMLLIPNAFILTRNSKVDEYLGMFSYPIYLCHVIATDAMTAMIPSHAYTKWNDAIAVALVSTALVVLVEVPMDRVRKASVARAKRAIGAPLQINQPYN